MFFISLFFSLFEFFFVLQFFIFLFFMIVYFWEPLQHSCFKHVAKQSYTCQLFMIMRTLSLPGFLFLKVIRCNRTGIFDNASWKFIFINSSFVSVLSVFSVVKTLFLCLHYITTFTAVSWKILFFIFSHGFTPFPVGLHPGLYSVAPPGL